MANRRTHDRQQHHAHPRGSRDCHDDNAGNRWAWPDATLLALGGVYFARLIHTGDLANYVNMRFAWVAWAGMAAFFLLALAKIIPARGHDHGDDCCESRPSWKSWVLALPIAIGMVLPSRPLDSSAIQSADPDMQAILREEVGMGQLLTPEAVEDPSWLYSLYDEVYPDKRRSYDDPPTFTLLDWFRFTVDPPEGDDRTIEGMPVDVIGFAYRDATGDRSRFVLTRFFMRHCLFDTVPIGIPVQWEHGAGIDDDDWLRVRGTMDVVSDAAGKKVVTIIADDIDRVEQPEVPYLYPDTSM